MIFKCVQNENSLTYIAICLMVGWLTSKMNGLEMSLGGGAKSMYVCIILTSAQICPLVNKISHHSP